MRLFKILMSIGTIVLVFLSADITQAATPSINTPSDFLAKAKAATQITICWKESSDNETGFIVEQKTGSCESSNPWEQIADLPENSLRYTVSGLSPNTTYSLRAFAYNESTNSDYSNCASASSAALGTPPAPTNLKAESESSDAINLNWTAISTNEDGFEIWRKAGSDSWELLSTTGPDIISHKDNTAYGNTSSTSYRYYVLAYNSLGDSPMTYPVIVPFQPIETSATMLNGIGKTKVTWIDNSNIANGFEVWRKLGACTSTGAWTLVGKTAGNRKFWIDRDSSPNTKYSYKVKAYKRTGNMLAAYGFSSFSTCYSLNTDEDDGNGDDTNQELLVLAGDISFVGHGVISETKTRTVTDYSHSVQECTYTYDRYGNQTPHCTTTYDTKTEYYKVDTDVFKYTINTEIAGNSSLSYIWYVSGDASIREGEDTSEASLSYDENDKFFLSVVVFDSSGNSTCKTYSSSSGFTSDCSDKSAPPVPTDITTTVSGYDQIDLTWSASDDDNGIIGYRVYRDSILASFSTTTSYSDTGLNDETEYCYTVSAIDFAGNESTRSTQECVTTPLNDVVEPTTPIGMEVSIGSYKEINLSWTASADNVDVAGYNIYKNNEYLESASETSFTDMEINGNTYYCYTVSAYDEAGNESPKSIETCITTEGIDYPARDKITNSLGMTFVYIEPGTFMMGSPTHEPGRWTNETLHQVTLTQGFYMQATEVTQGQWKAVMGSNPSSFNDCGADCPVENVSWSDVQNFIDALNAKGEGTYRLPTEAEWEYACRAGSTTAFANGGITEIGIKCGYDPNLDAMGWYCGNADFTTHPVAQKQANAWGLYDMHSNVQNWCQDWYADYPSEAVTNPTGPSSGKYRVYRGGSLRNNATSCRSACRFHFLPGLTVDYIGFRLVAPQVSQ